MPVSSLLPHEETIPSHVERIASEIKRQGIQRDPIIFDAESQAVLDGMHRLAAFVKLGLEYVVCSPVDYSSKTLSLNRWARVYTLHESTDMNKALFDAGISSRCTLLEAFTGLDERRGGLAAISSREVLMPAAPTDLDGAFAMMRALDAQGRKPRVLSSSRPNGRKTAFRRTSLSTKSGRRVSLWRKGGYPGVTRTTARLLEYWKRPDRGCRLFFCQIEALETAIYLTEVARKYGDAWIENRLREANDDCQSRSATALPSRWPRAPARPSSWPC